MEKESQFNQLYDSHYAKVFRLCRGYFQGNDALASDTAQDIFIKIWEHLDSFRNQSSISTWLYRISVNTCLMHLRKQSVKKEKSTDQLPSIAAEATSHEEEEKMQKMYACIHQLGEQDKLITLMMLEGIAYEQIAEVVGISEETLRVRIHRIKKSLTQCVKHGNV